MKQKQGLDYVVSFDTKEMPGKIVGVRVQLDTVILSELSEVQIDLADHPLYPALQEYVMNNPRGKR